MLMMAPQFPSVNSLQSDPPTSSTSEDYQALRRRRKPVDGLKLKKKSSSSCSVRTKRSFAIKHIIRQNGNLLQSNCTRDVDENMFQATRLRSNAKIK